MIKACLICLEFYRSCMMHTVDGGHYFDGHRYYTRTQCKEVFNKCTNINRCLK